MGYIVLLVILIGCFAFCCLNFFKSEEMAGLIRQRTEEKLADKFVKDAQNGSLETSSTAPAEGTGSTAPDPDASKSESSAAGTDAANEPSNAGTDAANVPSNAEGIDLDYEDERYIPNEYGIYYTPDYAVGVLDCVLEIPKIKMRRGVYTGTQAQINRNLAYWMTTTAEPGYKLGETVYCIYGHNSPVHSLSFNDLWTLVPGDIFLLTTDDSVYLYDVTRLSYEFREVVQNDYVRNRELPKDKCYIATCAQGEYAGRDVLVEGTLRKKYTLEEWNTSKDVEMNRKIELPVEAEKTKTELSAEIVGNELVLTLTDASGKGIENARLTVTDNDGMFLPGYYTGVPTDAGGKATFPLALFTPGEKYWAGVRSFADESYEIPLDRYFTVQAGSESGGGEKLVPQDTGSQERGAADFYMIIWGAMLGVLFLLIILCIILLISSVKSKKKDVD